MAEPAEKTLQLTVVTPAGIAWSRAASAIVLQTTEGQIEVRPGHTSLVVLLEPGEMWIVDENHDELFAAGEGFAEIRSNEVNVFTDLAQEAQTIEPDAAETAKQRAEQMLAEAAGLSDEDRSAALLAVKECVVKIKIAARGKDRRRTSTPHFGS